MFPFSTNQFSMLSLKMTICKNLTFLRNFIYYVQDVTPHYLVLIELSK